MKIYIYQIWFPTSKKCYIGQTDNLERRMKAHFKSGHLICRALWKYDDWQISILHTCQTRDESNRIEIEEIRNFNSIRPNGYNISRGGDGGDTFTGRHHTEETKKKMSESQKGNKHLLGFKPSEEQNKNQSRKMQGNQYAKGKNLGNQYAQGREYTEEQKKIQKEFMAGNQYAKGKNLGRKNPNAHSVQSEIKRLKTRIAKLKVE